MSTIVSSGKNLFKIIHISCLHQSSDFLFFQLIVDWNQQRIDFDRFHFVVLLGTLDPLQIQKIKFTTVSFCDLCQIITGEKFFLLLPYEIEVVEIQSHTIVKKRLGFPVGYPDKRDVVFAPLHTFNQFVDRRARCHFLNIQSGVFLVKLQINREINGDVSMVKNAAHTFFDQENLIAFEIERQKCSLF